MSTFRLVEDNTVKILKALEAQKLLALELCGMEAEKYAKTELTDSEAVDTGLLRNSVTYCVAGKSPAISTYSADKPSKYNKKTPTGKPYSGDTGSVKEYAVYVGTNVEYAPYIEFGTGKHYGSGRRTKWKYKSKDGMKTTDGKKPRPFIKPAIAKHGDKYKTIIERVLKGEA